ncbi:hypothetical protein [Agrococcus jenensis]|uniref:Uncharacterized protein n=1 Tax=Agrococcus jenensis TaxID=46353 RepID=A0A3N2ARY8_9MICO|nr:hypothetical protein [Agrococcus jenensis]ROR65811.1 hypothetical protein EDD26_1181 [Agrococcus jenensis]
MKKMLAATAVAAFAVLGIATPAQAAPPDNAAQNTEAYWEAMGYGDCTKVELPDGVGSYTLDPIAPPSIYTLLVLKSGSGASANDVIMYPWSGMAYMHSTSKDLSHIIYCVAMQQS